MTIKDLKDLLSEYKDSRKLIIETNDGYVIEDVIVSDGLNNEVVITEFLK